MKVVVNGYLHKKNDKHLKNKLVIIDKDTFVVP